MKTRLLSIVAMAIAASALFVTPALAWHNWVEGRPTLLYPGSDKGYYFWHDGDGLHLETTGPGPSHDFTGTLTTDGTFTNVALVRPEGDDSVVDAGGHTLSFHFRTENGIDGVNFMINGGAELSLTLSVDGHPIDPARIDVGSANAHPAHSSFTIYR